MQVKNIIAVAATLVATSSFAANINVTGGAGFYLVVTDTVNNTSYDLDLNSTYANFIAGNSATTTTAASWAVNDANWTSFYNAGNSANYVWSVFASKTGSSTTANANHLLTTVNVDTNVSDIAGRGASQVGATASNLSLVAADINTKSQGAASFVGVKGADIAFVGDVGMRMNWKLNNTISPDFLSYNAIGASSAFLDITNTGGKGTANVFTTSTFQGQFSFNGSTLSFAAPVVTPSVPEPETYGLALVGVLVAGAVARRRAA
ncbi:MAG: hypothetical protein RI907_1997 [Pseudomonadota bacterium]|jgi:hypothetical protein